MADWKILKLNPVSLVADEGAFQLRAGKDTSAVEELMADMERRGFLDAHPITVFDRGGKWHVIDGFHRREAAILAGMAEVVCEVFEGTEEEALIYGVMMNRKHGRQLDERKDFKVAAKKLRARGLGVDAIANVLWPMPKEKWRKRKNRRALRHPRDETVRSWLNPIVKENQTRRSVRLGKLQGEAARIIKEEDPEAIISQMEPDEFIERSIKRLEKELKAAKEAQLTAEEVRRTIYELAEKSPDQPAWLLETGTPGKRGGPVTIWSDWHWGETVRSEEVGGINEFNKEVATERVHRLVQRTIDLCYNHMGKAETVYPGIVVCLGGDMISGGIHDELRETDWAKPMLCVHELRPLLISALKTLADKFGHVYVPCVVGNHGRATMKPRMKERIFTSYEWNLYTGLEAHFKAIGDDRISFEIPEETDVHFRVYNHRFLLTHGDNLGVRGGDGIIGAIGPITRGTIKTGRAEAQVGRDFDTILMGHWHQLLWLPNAIVNNSLKGYDEFARLYLRTPATRPSQALWFVHPEHGITARWEVFLEPDLKADKKATWISVRG